MGVRYFFQQQEVWLTHLAWESFSDLLSEVVSLTVTCFLTLFFCIVAFLLYFSFHFWHLFSFPTEMTIHTSVNNSVGFCTSELDHAFWILLNATPHMCLLPCSLHGSSTTVSVLWRCREKPLFCHCFFILCTKNGCPALNRHRKMYDCNRHSQILR